MKMSKKPSSKHLLVARILLGLFFVSFVIIFILKLVNVSKTNGKIGADFMTVLTGFGVTLAKPVKWGAGLDEFCNIAMITWIPLILIVSLIFYILYYKNLVKTIQVEDSTTKVDITIKTEGDVIVETEKEEQPMKKEEVMVVEQLPMSEPVVEPEPMMAEPMIEEPVISEPMVEEPMMSEPVVEPEPVVMPMPVMVEPETKPAKKRKKKKVYPQVTKGMLLEELYEDPEFVEMTKVSIKTIFDKAFIVAGKNLVAGDHVVLAKFGKFETIEKEAQMKMNPLTQEQVEVPAHKVVKFKLSKSVKEKMNE
ncbi:HU family DNA-binding protein [Mycoplasma feriruminatoris]|uniref:HU family DNA-binding protein n=1 Tax=Mycoplasma feriruminatoris TaxID=1179777 RepID=UPI00241DC899|nr:HU family DNA-binding protein [Mycoplasma feriruminatoris]